MAVHGATSSEDTPREVPASEILAKILKGEPILYSNCIIKGTMYLNFLEINSNVDFENTLFQDNVAFQRTKFNGYANFLGSKFNGEANFFGSKFNGEANFFGSKFNGKANFFGSKFNGYANFESSNFNEDANFESSNFNEDANFKFSNFSKATYFGEPFESGRGACFNRTAHFGSAKFNEDVCFRDCRFARFAYFGYSNFNGRADFTDAKFLELLDLTQITFSRLDVYWPNINHISCDDGPTYLALIKNFRELEQYEAVDALYYQYRHWRQDQRPWSDGYKYYDLLALYTCGYGVKAHYTIACGLIVLVLFGIVYTLIIWYKDSSKVKSFRYLFCRSLFFSAIILISAPKELYPLDDKTYEKYTVQIKYLPILERLIGWGLLLLLINTLSRVMIRY